MQGNINIPDSTITTNLSFRQLVLMNMQQLTNFPYIEKDFDALTDYELLSLVVKYLNDVIANQNEQNDSITRMYESFLALQTYVNNTKDTLEDAFNELDNYVRNYFDNLDVQEEINNKLDQMLKDGVLTEIIQQFLQSTAIWCFDNVADMKNATNLINGSYARTLGYYAPNDGGGSLYKITNIENQNELQEELSENLYATLIFNKELKPEMIGAYGDGIQDDSLVFTKLSNYLTNKTEPITIILDKDYKIFNKFTITNCYKVAIDGKGKIDKYINNYSDNDTDIIYFYNSQKCIVKNITIESHVIDTSIQTTRQSSYYAIFVTSYDDNITDEVVIDHVTYKDGYNVINATEKSYNGAICISGYYSNERPSNIKITNNTIINGCGRIMYCTHCKDIIIDNNNLINLGHNPNNFTATAGNVIFREITCNNVNISNNNVILSNSEDYSFGETHVFELNTNDSTSNSGPINDYLASNNIIDMGNSGSAPSSSVIRLECANNVNINDNVINCHSSKLINTRTVEDNNEWDKITIRNNIINADTNSLFSVSGTLNSNNSPIVFINNNFNLNTTGNYITIDSLSYRYAGYRFIDNFLKTSNYQGIASNSSGSKPQIVTSTNYYEITPSAVSDGVLTIPHNANYVRFITFSNPVTITNIVSSANDFDDGFVLNITSDLNGDKISFSNTLVLNSTPITLEKYKGMRIIYNKANNRWYQI